MTLKSSFNVPTATRRGRFRIFFGGEAGRAGSDLLSRRYWRGGSKKQNCHSFAETVREAGAAVVVVNTISARASRSRTSSHRRARRSHGPTENIRATNGDPSKLTLPVCPRAAISSRWLWRMIGRKKACRATWSRARARSPASTTSTPSPPRRDIRKSGLLGERAGKTAPSFILPCRTRLDRSRRRRGASRLEGTVGEIFCAVQRVRRFMPVYRGSRRAPLLALVAPRRSRESAHASDFQANALIDVAWVAGFILPAYCRATPTHNQKARR